LRLKPFAPMTGPVSISLMIVVALQAMQTDVVARQLRYVITPPVAESIPWLQFVAFIVLGMVFLTWVHRLSAQLHAQTEMDMAYSPGWAVGWFFVPFANLFKPFQVMNELWVVAHRDAQRKGSVLACFWGLWILGTALQFVRFLWGTGSVLGLIGQLAMLAAPTLLLVMVLRMARAYSTGFKDLATSAVPVLLSEAPGSVAAGWHPDPAGRHEWRFWDGSAWTSSVSSRGLQGEDPF
jgi:hypothetical protein